MSDLTSMLYVANSSYMKQKKSLPRGWVSLEKHIQNILKEETTAIESEIYSSDLSTFCERLYKIVLIVFMYKY